MIALSMRKRVRNLGAGWWGHGRVAYGVISGMRRKPTPLGHAECVWVWVYILRFAFADCYNHIHSARASAGIIRCVILLVAVWIIA